MEAERWKDVFQLLKGQSKKVERLARTLCVIQQDMLRNNPGFVKDSVNEAIEVLGGMLNTYKCLLESGVEIQKRLESQPATEKMGIFRRKRSVSLGDSPKSHAKGEKRAAPFPPQEKTPKRRKGGPSPLYAQVTKSQALIKEGDWQVVTKRDEKNDEGEGPCAKSTGNCLQAEVEALRDRQIGRSHVLCVQLLLLPQQSFRGLRDPDPPP